MSNTLETKLFIPARLTFLNVFEPRKQDDGAESFSACILIPKEAEGPVTDPVATVKAIKEMVKAVALESFPKGIPEGYRHPLRDGDKNFNDAGDPRFPGYFFMNVKSKRKPLTLDWERNPANPADWNSGDYGVVKVRFFNYDKAGNRGAGVQLDAIQFVDKGDPMGGGGFTSPDEFNTYAKPANIGTVAAAPAVGNAEYDPFADD